MNNRTEQSEEIELTTFQIRLPQNLRDEFIKTAKQNNVSGASVIKDFMRSYVRSRNSKVAPWGGPPPGVF